MDKICLLQYACSCSVLTEQNNLSNIQCCASENFLVGIPIKCKQGPNAVKSRGAPTPITSIFLNQQQQQNNAINCRMSCGAYASPLKSLTLQVLPYRWTLL